MHDVIRKRDTIRLQTQRRKSTRLGVRLGLGLAPSVRPGTVSLVLLALTIVSLHSQSANAQSRRGSNPGARLGGVGPAVGVGAGGGVGIGVGAPGWSYYGLPFGPYAWGYPGAAGSFWTNGLSLYGPPVPTYGPVVGSFGGGDAHRFHPANPLAYGWFGPLSPSPRHLTPTVSVYPTGRAELTGASRDIRAPREPIPPSALPAGTHPVPSAPAPIGSPTPAPIPPAGCLRLCVKVPDPAAQVWVEGVPIEGPGRERWVESPPLEPGQDYRYTVTARWGTDSIATRTISGQAGQTATVEFTTADAQRSVPVNRTSTPPQPD